MDAGIVLVVGFWVFWVVVLAVFCMARACFCPEDECES
jgi:hypothetical protein